MIQRQIGDVPAGDLGGPGDDGHRPVPRRVEFWGDAPRASIVVALVFAVVRDTRDRLLLTRRVDTGNWELPGGKIEPGETVTDAAVREVAEETGVPIAVTGLAGVFCDPSHVVVYPRSGEARQQHVTLVHAVAGPQDDPPRPDHHETDAASWVAPGDLTALAIHPSVQLRIDHGLRHHLGLTGPHLG